MSRWSLWFPLYKSLITFNFATVPSRVTFVFFDFLHSNQYLVQDITGWGVTDNCSMVKELQTLVLRCFKELCHYVKLTKIIRNGIILKEIYTK